MPYAAAVFLLAPACATAQVRVSDPWVRATVPQQKISGAFMQLSSSRDARLVEIRSAVAGAVEIHEMAMDKGVMRMRPVPGVDLPAGRTVELKPGGYHVMLMDLKQPVTIGATVPLRLTVEYPDQRRETVEINAAVRALGASQEPEHKH